MTVVKLRQKKSDKSCPTWHCMRTLVSILLGLTLGSFFYHAATFNYNFRQDDSKEIPVDRNTSSSSVTNSLAESDAIVDPLFKNPFEYHVDEAPQILSKNSNGQQRMDEMLGRHHLPPPPRQRKEKKQRKGMPLPDFHSRGGPDILPIHMSFLQRSSIASILPDAPNIVGLSQSDEVTGGSIFDCDGGRGKCRYFYPSHFFIDPSHINSTSSFSNSSQYAKGSKFYHLLEEMEKLIQERKLWLHMPYVGLWTMSFFNDKINPETNQNFQQQNLTFLHVHKTVSDRCLVPGISFVVKENIDFSHTFFSLVAQSHLFEKGGTTVVKHANSRIQSITGKATQHFKVFMFQWLVGQQNSMAVRLRGAHSNAFPPMHESPAMFETTLDHLKHATKYKQPSEWNARDHLLFGIVRDPTERFISMIGQAFGAHGSARNGGVAEELKRDCLNSETYSLDASRFTIQCVISKIKEHGYFFEIHFTPQAVEVAFSTQMTPNIPVALFPFENLKEVLTEIGCSPDSKVRDGGGRYRPSPVLQSMSVNDYTPDLVRQICELYEVDVILLRMLGWTASSCDPYIQ